MNDISKLEQKIDSLQDRHNESSQRMERSITKMSESIETFVGFQARAEERQISNNRRLDKVEGRVDKLWDMVHKNALIVNGAVAIVTAVLIWVIKSYIGD